MSAPNKESLIGALALCKCCTLTDADTVFENFVHLYSQFEHWNPNSEFSSRQLKTKYYKGLKKASADDDSGLARELWDEMTQEQQMEIWNTFGDESGIRSNIKELLAATGVKAA